MLSANALALTKCIKRPCMVYEDKLKKSSMEEVKLSELIDDMKKTKTCPVFDGMDDIEGLLYTEERFRKAARQLQFFTGPELYDNFEELLRETAEEHWTQIVSAVPNNVRTPNTFDEHMKEFYIKYVDVDARDQMFAYIDMLVKPRNSSPNEHVNQMTTLLRYSNKLPGTEAIKDEESIKKIIFKSFPDDWQITYNRSGRNLQDQTMAQVLQFMKDEKNYKDNQERKKQPQSEDRGKQNGKRKYQENTYQHGGRKQCTNKNPCKYHDGHHDWKDCIFNSRSKNYKPDCQKPSLKDKESQGNATAQKHGGYRQGPHYYYDPRGPPQTQGPPSSFMALPPPVFQSPQPSNSSGGTVTSDVSYGSFYNQGERAPTYYTMPPPRQGGW